MEGNKETEDSRIAYDDKADQVIGFATRLRVGKLKYTLILILIFSSVPMKPADG